MRTAIPIAGIALVAAACGPSPSSLQGRAVEALTNRLAPLQRQYFIAHGTYAPDATTLLGGLATVGSLRVLVYGDRTGWHGSVFDPALAPASCITSVGTPSTTRILRGGLSVRRSGDVVCIDFTEWKRNHRIVEATYDSAGTAVSPAARRGHDDAPRPRRGGSAPGAAAAEAESVGRLDRLPNTARGP